MTLYTTGRRPFLWTKENEWSQEKKQAIQCGWPVCMKNAVTQITEGSQRPSDLFWEMWLQMVPRACEMLGPDYSFLESWHIQGNFKVRCKVIKYSPQKIKLLTWSALILAKYVARPPGEEDTGMSLGTRVLMITGHHWPKAYSLRLIFIKLPPQALRPFTKFRDLRSWGPVHAWFWG